VFSSALHRQLAHETVTAFLCRAQAPDCSGDKEVSALSRLHDRDLGKAREPLDGKSRNALAGQRLVRRTLRSSPLVWLSPIAHVEHYMHDTWIFLKEWRARSVCRRHAHVGRGVVFLPTVVFGVCIWHKLSSQVAVGHDKRRDLRSRVFCDRRCTNQGISGTFAWMFSCLRERGTLSNVRA